MMKAHGIYSQLSRGSSEKRLGSARRKDALQHNNGMHPTANSAAFIGNLNGFEVVLAAGDAERYVAILKSRASHKHKI